MKRSPKKTLPKHTLGKHRIFITKQKWSLIISLKRNWSRETYDWKAKGTITIYTIYTIYQGKLTKWQNIKNKSVTTPPVLRRGGKLQKKFTDDNTN